MIDNAIKEFITFIDSTGGNKSTTPFPSGVLERLETHRGTPEIDALFAYLSVVNTRTACSLPDQIIDNLRMRIKHLSPLKPKTFYIGLLVVGYLLPCLDAPTGFYYIRAFVTGHSDPIVIISEPLTEESALELLRHYLPQAVQSHLRLE